MVSAPDASAGVTHTRFAPASFGTGAVVRLIQSAVRVSPVVPEPMFFTLHVTVRSVSLPPSAGVRVNCATTKSGLAAGVTYQEHGVLLDSLHSATNCDQSAIATAVCQPSPTE